MSDRKTSQINAGLILIAVGLGLFLIDRVEGIGPEAVMLVIGAAFLIAYFVRKKYGLLVPGCILLGIGIGQVGRESFLGFGESSSLGLAFGFIAIYVIARLYEGKTQWWPLIPGGVMLILVGAFRGGEK